MTKFFNPPAFGRQVQLFNLLLALLLLSTSSCLEPLKTRQKFDIG